ncbi:glucose/arabinose dehydrogenase [Pseudonocardia kunmingensis]|uniref:Glucose/arabinose dehydrogenase n=1 Tax=Pseudonocardia kunmingensis TaxID=630975 RepID=A0A543DZV3_9PSEU|nr:glucose/arabinose dehydrogenase [Pseudonocardia kunmingensis]
MRRAAAAALLGLLLAGCATFPEQGPREWHEQLEGAGELGGPPVVPEPSPPPQTPPQPGQEGQGGEQQQPSGCEDPDPQVVATCLDPVGAIAVLPDAETALVGERRTGRVLRVQQDTEPELVATVPVDPSGGGGLTGLVLSPSFVEDQLVYAYITTPQDNRVVRLAANDPPEPVLTGIPRGATNNGGALAVDDDGSLLVATGNAGQTDPAPASLAGKLLRIDAQGRPADGNPDPVSTVLSSGLQAPGGICVDPARGTAWITDRRAGEDALHLVVPGPLPAPAWRWPDRPGVAGCAALDGTVAVPQVQSESLFVIRSDVNNLFVGAPEQQLQGAYGRMSAATIAPDGLVWLGTINKAGGEPVPSDDRVIRIQPLSAGGDNRQ